MDVKRFQTWIWILIYAGLIGIGVGLMVQRTDASFGLIITMLGALLAAIGVLMIWIRSRMNQP